MKTPISNVELFDDIPAIEAVLHAWVDEGVRPHWHKTAQNEVRSWMPLLARALDRLASENKS